MESNEHHRINMTAESVDERSSLVLVSQHLHPADPLSIVANANANTNNDQYTPAPIFSFGDSHAHPLEDGTNGTIVSIDIVGTLVTLRQGLVYII
jgi:hypothetical protein